MLDDLLQDFRYAARQIANSPSFSLIILLTLALGIGANTAIFSIINEQMLQPLKFAQADRLLRVPAGSSYLDIVDLQKQSKTIEKIGGIREQFFDLTEGTEAERISGAMVTGSFFSVLGAAPIKGRTIQDRDDIAGGDRVVVLGESFWRNRLASDPQIIGK